MEGWICEIELTETDRKGGNVKKEERGKKGEG
jgi:hypothetical protein